MTHRLLAIDAGNTRIKWGVHDGAQWLTTASVPTGHSLELGSHWSELPPLHKVIIANVAGLAAAAAIRAALPSQSAAHWLISAPAQCGVKNSYRNPAQLGSDRWAALIGARHWQSGALVVVNVGTALTVDALTDDGEFLGGVIVPGARLMQQALADHTALPELPAGQFQSFPQTTADAIAAGAIQALAGAVERVAAALATRVGCRPRCLLSGGHAALLAPYLNLELQLADNLVLEGLRIIADDMPL